MDFRLSDRTYEIAKHLVLVVMPALAALYITLGNLWGLPAIEEVSGSITALAAAIGTMLTISTRQYNRELEDD